MGEGRVKAASEVHCRKGRGSFPHRDVRLRLSDLTSVYQGQFMELDMEQHVHFSVLTVSLQPDEQETWVREAWW